MRVGWVVSIVIFTILFYNTIGTTTMPGRKLRKVTYSLPEALLDDVRTVVRDGAAPSYSAFVEEALAVSVRRAHEEQLSEAFRSAADDPEFLADVHHALRYFSDIDDGLERNNG
jgi:Arc/MetJ-type ribon-helix-helix transcriptional regulator